MSDQVYISEAHLKGYKSIIDAKVQFKPGLNIIIGKNGSGKTNLVEYFNYLLNFELDEFIEAESRIELSQEIEKLVISFKKHLQLDDTGGIISVKQEITINDKEVDGKEFDMLQKAGMQFLLLILRYNIPNSIPIIEKPIQLEDKFNNKYFSEEIISFIKENNEFVFSNNLLAFLAFRMPNDSLKDKLTNAVNKSKNDLLNLTRKFTSITDIRINSNFSININSDRLEIKDLSFEYFSNGIWNKFGNLSDGTKRLLFIISEIGILTKSFWGKEHLSITTEKTDKIVFLEEPELGIHPHQLHLLMNFIKEESEDKQIIITTHSPQVLNVLSKDELDRILICEWTEEKGTQLRNMSEDEMEKAKIYIKEVGYLSDYWLHSDFNRI